MTNIDDLIARLDDVLRNWTNVTEDEQSVIRESAAALREQQAEIARLIDACNGMIGLVQLIASRDDLPVGLDDVMLLNHRLTEAKAAIDAAMNREQETER